MIICPYYSDFKLLKEKVSEQESLFQKQEAYFLNLEDSAEKLETYKESLEKINSALPETLSIASLLNFIQKEASENGLILKSLVRIKGLETQTKEEGENPEIKESYFSFNFIGSPISFENFLKSIEKSSRIIEVENISLTKAEGGFLEITLLLKVYYIQ